ncbi:MAG: radical SAM protein [Candidatus Bathyarchaeota archaeon]|nr:radical SAM protein [Candidatus Bathyarchaeota archaeon]
MNSVPELNVVKKDWRKVDLKIALCYPNVYRAGMSGLTVRLLYGLINSREDVLCERFFMPTSDEPIRSLESNQPLKKFDVIAFTLQYEEDYPNVIRMLIESSIQPRRNRRSATDPIIIGGGPCATSNPEPLAEFFDLFLIGEAEPVIDILIDRIESWKDTKSGVEELADIKGVYVPEISNQTDRVWCRDFNSAFFPIEQQIPIVNEKSPYMTVFGKSFAIEPIRGCSRFCRFCLYSHISFPQRERSLEKVEEIIEEGIRRTPVDKVSLIGASIFNYKYLEDLCDYIVSSGLRLALPSIRPENVTEHLAKILRKGQQRNVTLAPDAATPKMQEIIGKRMSEADMVDAVKILLRHEIRRLKLYFIIGLPSEEREDVEAIAELSKKIADAGYGPKAVHISINPLIPKPHTPFQNENPPSVAYTRSVLRLLRAKLRGDRRITIECLDPRYAQIQSLLSLGDRRLGDVVELVARYGGGLGAWRRSLKTCGINLEKYLRDRNIDEYIPWKNINVGANIVK